MSQQKVLLAGIVLTASRASRVARKLARRSMVDGLNPLDRMRINEGHLRASVVDGSRSGSGVSDPTGSSAGRPDPGHADFARMHHAVRQIERHMRTIEAIAAANEEPRKPTELDRLALDRLNITPEPGCASCARIEGDHGGVRWEPTDVRFKVPTDVAGVLDEPMFLCRWCYDAVERWGRLPSTNELERHHRGERVPWPSDVPRPDASRKGA